MAEHEIVWTYEQESVGARAVCNDDACQYRWVCSEECEWISGVEKHGDGYRHAAYAEDGDAIVDCWHDMVAVDYCNWVESCEAERDLVMELNAARETFEIARTAVTPSWAGEGAEWSRVAESVGIGEGSDA